MDDSKGSTTTWVMDNISNHTLNTKYGKYLIKYLLFTCKESRLFIQTANTGNNITILWVQLFQAQDQKQFFIIITNSISLVTRTTITLMYPCLSA